MIVILFCVLCIAIYFDITSWRIPNWLTLPGVVVGLGFSYYLFGLAGFLDHSLGALIAGGVWFVFWQTGCMGGGDQKLMMVVGSFLGADRSVVAIFLVALFGGVQALMWVWYYRHDTAVSWRQLFRKIPIPYSIAIAGGASIAGLVREIPRFFS